VRLLYAGIAPARKQGAGMLAYGEAVASSGGGMSPGGHGGDASSDAISRVTDAITPASYNAVLLARHWRCGAADKQAAS